jgi:hypothetical protein
MFDLSRYKLGNDMHLWLFIFVFNYNMKKIKLFLNYWTIN